jgi:hypothetical protein
MRWLILLPPVSGAIGQHIGLRAALLVASALVATVAIATMGVPGIRSVRIQLHSI